MEILKDRYTITELSERLNITDHTLRYYEKEFNLSVPKDHRGRRYYTPEVANVMYQIKSMRNEGLEIKAIRKILQSEDVIKEPPPVVLDDSTVLPVSHEKQSNLPSLKQYFDEFKEELTGSLTAEVSTVKDQITQEIYKSKLELGACVENSVRKLESKMEKHFQEVDRSIGEWRQKNKQSFFKRLINRKLK